LGKGVVNIHNDHTSGCEPFHSDALQQTPLVCIRTHAECLKQADGIELTWYCRCQKITFDGSHRRVLSGDLAQQRVILFADINGGNGITGSS
jgi:hypothetical protein